MAAIRDYEERDAPAVGRLIADTYTAFNLGFVAPEQLGLFLGPFRHAASTDPALQAEVAAVIHSATVLVAEEDGEIVGVLRGRPGRLAGLFVRGDRHRRGIGRALVARFEAECRARGDTALHVSATVYAVPFYRALGFKRSTGLRAGRSFDGHGLPVQPMKKAL